MDVKFLIAGDRAVSVEFGSVISLEVNAKVRALDEKLKEYGGYFEEKEEK